MYKFTFKGNIGQKDIESYSADIDDACIAMLADLIRHGIEFKEPAFSLSSFDYKLKIEDITHDPAEYIENDKLSGPDYLLEIVIKPATLKDDEPTPEEVIHFNQVFNTVPQKICYYVHIGELE